MQVSSNLHPTRRRAVLQFQRDVTVFFNVARDNIEEERIDWNISRFIASAVTCREVPNLEDEDVKELNVNFHHQGLLLKSMNIHVPMTWTANLFLKFLSFTSFQNDDTISCVSSLNEDLDKRTNDICELVEVWSSATVWGLTNIANEAECDGEVSGGEYCGC